MAPTGSGKTLAAFLQAIDRLLREPRSGPGVRVLYVSPLKALAYDIERNLREPLEALRAASGAGAEAPRVAVRSGDTPARERRAQARDPAEILVTTPESLYLILGSQQRETLATVETVIVDEIHALAPGKRGVHLALSLERLGALCARDPQRIGLSATARPVEEVARYLGGVGREVAIVDAGEVPRLDLEVRVSVPDLTRPEPEEGASTLGSGPWAAILPRLLEQIRAHRSAIVFANSRGLCERLVRQLNELAGEELARAHHGSVATEQRREIEDALKRGVLRAIVATSSLELGIDMEAVELVLLVESPGSVGRGLQRIGRAGHRVGEASRGRIHPLHRADLLEASVVARGMRRGEIEALRVPRNPLDVLAQQVVAICAGGRTPVREIEALVRRCWSYRDLSAEQLHAVLDMLAGRYPSTDFAELRARVHWDRDAGWLEALPGSRMLALVSGGTIPDRGLYAVQRGADGPRIGELDEEMVHELRNGETLTLGASTWRVDEITRDRVIVSPAPGEVGKLPFWRGERPGRPVELGRAQGAFARELVERCEEGRAPGEQWLREREGLDEFAARNLVDYVVEQQRATGEVPSDRALVVERFRDELGDWRVCLLSPFGARLHAPWALAIGARISEGAATQMLWNDDGIALRFADGAPLPDLEALLPDPDELEDLVVGGLAGSALFAGQFRENAARALLLPRRRPGARTPLWTQRLRAQQLFAVAREHASFPIMLETYRSCLEEVFDLPATAALLRDLRGGRIRVVEVETRQASPFARSLVFAYTAAYLYQGDTPAAERRAQALVLDRAMLRDLLGSAPLRDLLDAEAIRDIERELQARAPERRARHADDLHQLLRRLGDLSDAEALERCAGDAAAWLAGLERQRRVARIELAGESRWIAADDAGLARDALSAAPQTALPEDFGASVPDALDQWLSRFARSRGPFGVDELTRRYSLDAAALEPVLASLCERGRLVAGEFRPDTSGAEWCDAEVLRRWRRQSLARLRAEVAPVDAASWARFLARSHEVGSRSGGEARLREAITRLEGLPLSFAELERALLPARVSDYDPRALDELGSRGEVVWIGCGALGARDARIALYWRERAALLAEAEPLPEEAGPLHRALLDELRARGARFAGELAAAIGQPPESELRDALRDLVAWGQVTNDTFAALRALCTPRPTKSSRRRPRRGDAPVLGRWCAVSEVLASAPDGTRRTHALARLLLERHGVVSREALALESIEGGFATLYPVYREMEEAGLLRRGHFVEALAGAQFAYAGTVDRLRSARSAKGSALWLAASDPANPFGISLSWPDARNPAATPRRALGAGVALVDGALALYLDASGRRLWSFEGGAADALERGIGALRESPARRRRLLRIEEVDGEPAARSHAADALLRAGFHADYKGLVLEREPTRGG